MVDTDLVRSFEINNADDRFLFLYKVMLKKWQNNSSEILNELEKAHTDVTSILLQVLEDGILANDDLTDIAKKL